jgi:hypothetical protein
VVDNVERGIKQSGFAFSGPGLLGACVAEYMGIDRAPFELTRGTVGCIQFLRFEPVTEIVSNFDGAELMQNKNGNSGIFAAYEHEARRAGVVRYTL